MTTRHAELAEVGGSIDRVANAARSWSERRSLLLRVEEDGFIGLGEASPLPGYSPDSFEEARRELLGWIAEGAIGDGSGLRSPSARCAIETASLDLRARRVGVPALRVLEPIRPVAAIPLAGLLPVDDEAAVVARAARLVGDGIRTLKLKVGADVTRETRVLAALRSRFGAEVTLRLDANGALDPERAAELLRDWARFDIELIEEPVAFGALVRLAPSPIPWALDESLQRPTREVEPLLASLPVAALVLKPMTLGLARCRELAALARGHGADVIVSHVFGGPVELQLAASLALALGSSRACGLARHAGLDAWPSGEGLEPTLIGKHRLMPEASTVGLGLDAEALWSRAERLP